jgi:hypothetical protein
MQDNPDFNARAHQRAANEEREREQRAELEEKRLAELGNTIAPAGQGVGGPNAAGHGVGGHGAAGLPAETVIPNLAAYINISDNLVLFQHSPSLKRVVPVAVSFFVFFFQV